MLLRSSSGCDFLVVGLGNPGSKYWNTRHNVGYAALDALAKDLGVTVDRVKFQGLTAQANLDGHKLILLKPTTYMNLSGQSVQAAAKFYKVPPEHILVLSDDISLDPGRLRVRKSGSAGGHNGLKSIIASIGSQDFPRIKIGVGAKPHPDYDLADWVLLVGGGEDLPKIQAKAQTLGIAENIRFLGVRSDVADLMQAMDVFVFPSLYEGLPVTMVEAQASGLPCLISDKVPEECIITEGLVDVMPLSASADAWAEKVLEKRKCPRTDHSEEVAAHGFDIEAEALKLQEFYQNVYQNQQ